MRALTVMALLPLAVACEKAPTEQPTPRATADPVVVRTETDRRDMFSQAPAAGDFDVRFGEPFISLDVRGNRIGISASGNYRIVPAVRSREGEAYVFRAEQGLAEGEEPFILTIAPQACRDSFSGERTRFTAYLGSAADPRRLSSCAASAR